MLGLQITLLVSLAAAASGSRSSSVLLSSSLASVIISNLSRPKQEIRRHVAGQNLVTDSGMSLVFLFLRAGNVSASVWAMGALAVDVDPSIADEVTCSGGQSVGPLAWGSALFLAIIVPILAAAAVCNGGDSAEQQLSAKLSLTPHQGKLPTGIDR